MDAGLRREARGMRLGGGLSKRAKRMAHAMGRALRFRNEEGSTLVEFAIVLPGLVALLTGVISFSMAFYSLQQLGNAAGTAVQAVANYQGLYPVTLDSQTISDPCEMALYQVNHSPSVNGWPVGLFTYTLAITDTSGTTTYSSTSGTSFSCSAGASEESQNEPVVLTVTYTYSWMPILSFSPKGNLTVVEGAVAD
jgi:Flp pilus assembly protein TadG